MRQALTLWIFFMIVVITGCAQSGIRTENTGTLLRKVSTIDLPGPPGKRFDYLTIDYDDGYLLSGHLGAGMLYLIDLKSNKLVAAVSDVPGVEGVEYVPELKKVYTSDWHENKVGVVDLRTKKVVNKIPTDDKPDGSAYAAPFKKLYVSNERGKSESVIDVEHDKTVTTLRFDSETGMPQYDEVRKLVWLNLQDQNLIVAIDPRSDEVVGRYPVDPCKGNHGMALDTANGRAFLACEENEKLAVFDLDKHKVLATLPLAGGPDVVKFDPGLKRVYVACYSGTISVFEEDASGNVKKLGDVAVEKRVHSLAVDKNTHRVYAPEEQEAGKPVARMVVYEAVPN